MRLPLGVERHQFFQTSQFLLGSLQSGDQRATAAWQLFVQLVPLGLNLFDLLLDLGQLCLSVFDLLAGEFFQPNFGRRPPLRRATPRHSQQPMPRSDSSGWQEKRGRNEHESEGEHQPQAGQLAGVSACRSTVS